MSEIGSWWSNLDLLRIMLALPGIFYSTVNSYLRSSSVAAGGYVLRERLSCTSSSLKYFKKLRPKRFFGNIFINEKLSACERLDHYLDVAADTCRG